MPYRLQVIGGLLVLLGLSTADLVPPYIGGRIVDTLVTKKSTPHLAMQQIILLVALLAATRLFAAALQYAQRRLNSWIGARTLMDIRIALFHRFNALSLSYYDKRSTGSVMARITNDADNLWDFLMDGAPWFLSNLLTLVFTSVVLFRMNARLAALLLIPAPFIYMLTRWFMPRARSRFRQVWQRISKMYSALNSALNGMRVIKAFAQEERENRLFEDRNRKVFEASFAANAMWALYFPALGLLMGLGSYIIWLVGGYTVLHGGMTLGMLTAFSGYLMQFYAPFQNFSRALDWSTRSLTAAERVFEVLDTEPEIKEAADAVSMPEMRGAVEFENVSFSYDKTKHVLENFSLKVEPGEMIGLVGHSGAGKTTIINLLARFYDVNEGCIKIDGVDIRKIKQEDFRRQFGIVLQEPFLFPGTIRDNIAYAKPHATVEEIIQAAKAANCHEFILQFPDGYDTYVGERGQRLSGGERQRISIARAILHDPKILILDEATASVDTETEKQIQEAIMHLVQNRTTFAIAHRLSTLRHAHRLVVLQEGKMVECGTHDELMEKDGVYANLVRIQTEVNRIRAV
jgi:ATP-binding cassette subfamily B protein